MFLAVNEEGTLSAGLAAVLKPPYPKGGGSPPIGLERMPWIWGVSPRPMPRRCYTDAWADKDFIEPINAHLAGKGLLMRQTTIVDVTIIDAPLSPKNDKGESDSEMTCIEWAQCGHGKADRMEKLDTRRVGCGESTSAPALSRRNSAHPGLARDFRVMR